MTDTELDKHSYKIIFWTKITLLADSLYTIRVLFWLQNICNKSIVFTFIDCFEMSRQKVSYTVSFNVVLRIWEIF